MWKLKSNISIVLRHHGVIINQDNLAKNQALAEIVFSNAQYNAAFGHNFIQVEPVKTKHQKEEIREVKPQDDSEEIIIQADLKKNLNQQPTSQDSASTSTEVPSDGQNLNKSEEKQPSESNASQPLKQKKGKRNLKEKRWGAFGAT